MYLSDFNRTEYHGIFRSKRAPGYGIREREGGVGRQKVRRLQVDLIIPPVPTPLLRLDIVQGALEWLEQNQDKTLGEINAPPEEADDPTAEPPALNPGEEARSLVCNDCGKRFRSQAQAEFHASKTQHVDFAESTEEIAPLTEEEKKAKLEELRLRLAEKRSGVSEQDKADKKRNEVSLPLVEIISVWGDTHDIVPPNRRFGARVRKKLRISKRTSRRKSS